MFLQPCVSETHTTFSVFFLCHPERSKLIHFVCQRSDIPHHACTSSTCFSILFLHEIHSVSSSNHQGFGVMSLQIQLFALLCQFSFSSMHVVCFVFPPWLWVLARLSLHLGRFLGCSCLSSDHQPYSISTPVLPSLIARLLCFPKWYTSRCTYLVAKSNRVFPCPVGNFLEYYQL